VPGNTRSSGNTKFNSNSINQSKNNSDKWKNAPNSFKKETAKAMVSIRQSGEFTNEELTQTQNIVDAMALFSVKEATGAKRRHYNKLKKSLAGYGQKVPPNQPNKPAPKAEPTNFNERTRRLCKNCNKMAKHRTFECKFKTVTANKATIKDVNRPGKVLEHVSRKVAKVNFTSTNPEDESDEECRYPGSFGTKAKEDGHVYAHYPHTTTAMDQKANLTSVWRTSSILL
jgi:hypothetical protein